MIRKNRGFKPYYLIKRYYIMKVRFYNLVIALIRKVGFNDKYYVCTYIKYYIIPM